MSGGVTISLVPYPLRCTRCGGKAVMYPSLREETCVPPLKFGHVACEQCTPEWMHSFLLFRLDAEREGVGLGPLQQSDLPDGIVLEVRSSGRGRGEAPTPPASTEPTRRDNRTALAPARRTNP